ncbi:unnamed protein product [Rotaria sordida]|nr:unnamed protein product [Rotaria sordida]
MSTEILYEKDTGTTKKLETFAKQIILGIGTFTGLVLLGLLIVIIVLLISVFLKNFNTNAVADDNTDFGEITQSFSTNWIPSKNQSMTVINTDEIARKLEAVYGIKPGSIRISTIMINNDQTNVDGRRHRRRRQLDRKKREIPRCDQLGSDRSIVEIAMNVIYPSRCGTSMSCKTDFVAVVQERIAAYMSNILLEFRFADGSFNELMLTRCHKDTDSSLNSLLRSRRAPKTTTTPATTAKATTAQATTTQATTAKATTTQATTAKATTAQATTAKTTTPKSAATSGKQLYVL